MSANETLLDKAMRNYAAAKAIYREFGADEGFLNIVGFHLQQAVELSLKYQLEMNGVEYKKTHDIEQILRYAKEEGVDLLITDFIYDKAEMLSSWEAKTRYITDFFLEVEKITPALTEVNNYLQYLEKNKEVFIPVSEITEDNDDIDY